MKSETRGVRGIAKLCVVELIKMMAGLCCYIYTHTHLYETLTYTHTHKLTNSHDIHLFACI